MNCRFAAACALLVLSAAPAFAGTIDTRPPTNGAGENTTTWYGQTFVADDRNLAQFSVFLNQSAPGFTVTLQVYNTAAGLPTGAALFTGAAITPGVASTEFSANPNIALTVGTTYAIVARVTAGVGTIGFQTVGTYAPGGMVVTVNTGASWLTTLPASDLSTRIIMNPEPGTMALFGLGIAGLGGLVVRRRRARLAPKA